MTPAAASPRLPQPNAAAFVAWPLTVAAALLAPVALVHPLAVAPLFAACALALAAANRGVLLALRPGRNLAIAALGFAVWALVSAAWSVSLRISLQHWPAVAIGIVAGLFLISGAARLDPGGRRRVADFLAAGVIVCVSVLAIDALARLALGESIVVRALRMLRRSIDLSSLNRGIAVLALIGPVAALALARARGRGAALALAAALAAIAVIHDSAAAQVAVVVGSIAAVAAALAPRATRIAGIAVIACGFALAPLLPRVEALHAPLADRANPVSVWHRAEIWSFVAGKIAERPVAGWGFNASRVIPGGTETLSDIPAERLPLHPHNAALQIWLELGAIGAALAAAVAIVAWAAATDPRLEPRARIAGAATVAASLAVASIGYGIWQGWWMASLWLTAAIAAAVLPSDREEPRA